jgi:hypothetical protein
MKSDIFNRSATSVPPFPPIDGIVAFCCFSCKSKAKETPLPRPAEGFENALSL